MTTTSRPPASRAMTRAEQAAAIVARAKVDYETFLRIVWPILSNGRAPLTAYEIDAFTWAVGQEPGRNNKRFLFAHREFGKSTGLTYAVGAWLWLSDPTKTGGVYTKSNEKAKEALTAARQLLHRCPMLRHLEPPEGRKEWQKDNTTQFSITGAVNPAVPSFKAMGSTSMSTGGRADFLIKDDFETLENSITREARQRTSERSREIIRTARDGALIIGVGTYARDQSCYQDWIDSGWEHRIYPILYPTDEEIALATNKQGHCYYAPCVLKWLREGRDYAGRPTAPGGIVQPERWTPAYIAEKRGNHLAEFRRHYMGIRQSAASDELPLRLSDLMVLACAGPTAPASLFWGLESAGGQSTVRQDIEVDSPGNADCFRRPAHIDSNYHAYQGSTVLHLDPAGFGSDEMAWSVWSKLNGFYYNRALRGVQLKSDGDDQSDRITLSAALNSIVRDIATFNITKVQVEAQFGGIAIADSIRRLLSEKRIPCHVETKAATGDKNRRILNTAKPLTYEHRVVIDESVANNPTFQHQYTRISPLPGCLQHDDQIEAWAAGLTLVSENDLSVPQQTRQLQTLEAERDDLMEGLGLSPPISRWGDHRRNQAAK